MTKFNTTKSKLLSSLLILALCVTMFVGSTYAWFTDSVTSAGNIITSGTLDVTMEWADGTKAVPALDSAEWNDASQGPMFTNQLWEPGFVDVKHIKIANEGTLALEYEVSILANGEVSNLANVIDVYYVDPAVQVENRTDLVEQFRLGTLTEVLDKLGETGNGTLISGAADTITIAFKMQESAGNEYMNKSIGTDFSVVLNATQLNAENDSFGPDYDEEVSNPIYSEPVKLPMNDDGEREEVPVKLGDDDDSTTTDYMVVNIPAAVVIDLPNEVESIFLKYANRKADSDNKTVSFSLADLVDQDGNVIDLTDNDEPFEVKLFVGDSFDQNDVVKVYHDGEKIAEATVGAEGYITYNTKHFCEIVVAEAPLVTIKRNGYGYGTIQAAVNGAQDGDTLLLRSGYNTSAAPLTETITVNKDITLVNGGMYLVSSAPATFKVVEGGKLTVTEGSFTIKNTSNNGAAVLVDGGEFVMEGGSFDAHTAVRTTEGKSSTATLAAGWSNRVTVAFDSKGNDTINVTGGTIYSSAEALKTTVGTYVNFNMSGGLLSSKTTQYSAAVNLQCPATVNMTGGKIENTYSSGYNGSSAIEANVGSTTINLSGTAALSSNGTAVMLGSHWASPAVSDERIVLNMSGDSSISATSAMGFGVRYAQDCCDVNISGNAKVNATYQAIQFNTNSYVYTNSTLIVAENAKITSTAGRIGGGYAIASNGHVTVTGGTISGSTAGIASFKPGAVVVIDNSVSGTPITINKVDIADGVTYTVAGNPTIG